MKGGGSLLKKIPDCWATGSEQLLYVWLRKISPGRTELAFIPCVRGFMRAHEGS